MINNLVYESEVVANVPEDYRLDFNGPIPEEEVGNIDIPKNYRLSMTYICENF